MTLNFSENIKRLRKEKGITQEALSEQLGVSPQSVSRWELGICYPDLEMLPSIANYFGVSIDSLLSNDASSKEKDLEFFNEHVYRHSDEDCIDFVKEYCRKYPESDYYAYHLAYAIRRYAVGDKAKTDMYMPLMLKQVERLLETKYRNASIEFMTMLCDEAELDKWLDKTPYNSSFSRRNCLVARASSRGEWEEAFIEQGLEKLEVYSSELDDRCPDRYGAKLKAEYQKNIMKVIESFGENGNVPDGWKCFYAYKQLVLSACLFRLGETDEAWKNFEDAIGKCKYVADLDDEWLDVGGILFSNIKVNKLWTYAIDEKGNKRKLFAVVRYSFYTMREIRELLTNPAWAWFNSVRETPRYQEALKWVTDRAEKAKD